MSWAAAEAEACVVAGWFQMVFEGGGGVDADCFLFCVIWLSFYRRINIVITCICVTYQGFFLTSNWFLIIVVSLVMLRLCITIIFLYYLTGKRHRMWDWLHICLLFFCKLHYLVIRNVSVAFWAYDCVYRQNIVLIIISSVLFNFLDLGLASDLWLRKLLKILLWNNCALQIKVIELVINIATRNEFFTDESLLRFRFTTSLGVAASWWNCSLTVKIRFLTFIDGKNSFTLMLESMTLGATSSSIGRVFALF